MLVIVHHRNIEFRLERVFDFEAFRGLDVFEIDTAERRGDSLHDFDELLRVLLVDFDIEHVDASVNFEEQSLAFHHRLARQSADVAEAQNRSTVANHRNEVALARIFVSEIVVFFNFKARGSNARSVSKPQVRLRAMRLGGHNFNLARLAHGMVFKSLFF